MTRKQKNYSKKFPQVTCDKIGIAAPERTAVEIKMYMLKKISLFQYFNCKNRKLKY